MPHDYSYFKFGGVSVNAENNVLDYIDTAISKFSKLSNGEYHYRSRRWKAYNLLSEMDVPGEYFIDRDSMMLYFYPTSRLSGSELEFEVKLKNMIEIKGAENVTFEGLTFTHTTGNAIFAEDIKNVDIKNCTFKDIGMRAVYYSGTTDAETGNKYTDKDGNEAQFWQCQKKYGSYNCDIENNVFMNIGAGAITMLGTGDIDTLTSSNNHIKNNILYNISSKSALYAITLGGCGVTVENNNISKAMNGGIYMYGNNHIVQYNEIYNLMAESADCGAIYQGRADVFRGSVVQYNYIHDMLLDDNKNYDGLHNSASSQCGIYWDDGQTGMNANHNILKNIPVAFASNHAGDYVHSFNTTLECDYAWDLVDYPNGETDLRTTVANDFTLAQLEELVVDKELYYDEYENLEAIVAGNNPKKYSVLEGNLRINSDVSEDEYTAATATFTNNQSATTEDLTTIFVDPENQDYRVKANSEYASLGVLSESFDIEQIGIQTDFELNSEKASFEKLYPAKNANIDYQDEYNFTWSDSLGANNYKVTVAEDKAFENVVFEGETVQTGIVVSGLSDETVYYWKVEAENSSRELANAWTTVEGVTSFGVNVSMYEDTATPEKPASLISGVYGTNGAGYGNVKDEDVEDKAGSVGTATRIKLYSDRPNTCDKNWYASGIVFQDRNKDSSYADRRLYPESNTNYVFSIRAKSKEGNAKVGFVSNHQSGSYTVADHDIAGVQLGTDWTDLNTTLSVGDMSAYSAPFFTFGIVTGTVSDYVIYDGASLYLAEEIEAELKVTSDATVLTPFGSINVTAEVLNQIGTKGNLNQDVEWFVVSADRTTVIEGAKIEVTDAGATISVDGAIPSGDYAIVAVSDTLVKGVDIKVLSSFEDTATPEKPASLTRTVDRTNGAGYANASLDEDKQGSVGTATKIVLYGDRPNTCDKNWYASGIVFQDRNKDSSYADRRLYPESNTNYVFSIRAKSKEGNAKVGFVSNHQSGSYTVADHDIEGVQLGTDWTDLNTTLSVGDMSAYTSPFFTFGIVTGTVSDYVIYDGASLYLAEEIAYSMNITGDNEIAVGEDAVISAEILNQIGTKGNLSQNFNWIALNTDRTAYADGVTLTENADGTVTVSGVEKGTYTILAMTEDNSFIKGYNVTVTEGEKIASAEFTQNGANVNFKATVENTDAEKVFFVIGEFNGNSLVKAVKSDIKVASEASCDLTLEGVTTGNTVKAFIWDDGTMRPIDNTDNLALTYTVLAIE